MKDLVTYITESKSANIMTLKSDSDAEALKDKLNEWIDKYNPKSIVVYSGKGLSAVYENASTDILYFVEQCLSDLIDNKATVSINDGKIHFDGGKDCYYSMLFMKVTPEEIDKQKGALSEGNDSRVIKIRA